MICGLALSSDFTNFSLSRQERSCPFLALSLLFSVIEGLDGQDPSPWQPSVRPAWDASAHRGGGSAVPLSQSPKLTQEHPSPGPLPPPAAAPGVSLYFSAQPRCPGQGCTSSELNADVPTEACGGPWMPWSVPGMTHLLRAASLPVRRCRTTKGAVP